MGKVEEPLVFTELEQLRNECAALQLYFIPDWSLFQKTAGNIVNNRAGHESILINALVRGELAQLTTPIHHYLLENNIITAEHLSIC